MRKEKLVLFILMAAFVVSSYAQNFEEQREERLKIYKASKKKNKDKALILSEEDAEQLLNDGWKTTPSALPLERQMDAMYIMQMEYDSKLFPAYVMAEANSVNQDYNAAKNRAVELAKSVLVEKIQSEISLQIDWAIKTELIESKEGEALIKSLKAAKNSISQNLEDVMIVEDIYRITSSKRFEVRVAIACTADYELLKEKCDFYLQNKKPENIVFVSGHASGADALGERYAEERGLQLETYPADWKAHGRAAGPISNAQMADVADALIAFWDGKSRGTKNMIDTATKRGLKVAVVRY